MIISAQETARKLNVSKQTVINLYHNGELKGFRVGKLIRFNDEEIEKYIKRQVGK